MTRTEVTKVGMKAMSNKSEKQPKAPVRLAQSRLETLAEAILTTDATTEAIADRLQETGLNDAESIELVDFLNDQAQSMLYGEHPVKMLELGQRALLISNSIGYEKGEGYGVLFTAVSQWFTTDLAESLANLLKAKSVFSELGDETGRMKTLTFEGCVYRSMGDYDQSYLDLQRCVVFFRKCGDVLWESTALLSLAITCEQLGDNRGLQRYNRRIIKVATAPEQQWMVGRAFDGIGTIYYNSGKYEKAREYYEKSYTTCRESHHPVGEARALNDIGMVYQQLGDLEKARHYYLESLRIRKEVGLREAQCTCLLNLGKLSLEEGKLENALGYFKEALETAIAVGAKPRISQAHENLSRAYEMSEDFVSALRHQRQFHETNEEVSREQSKTRTENLKTRLELDKAEKVAEVERLKNAKLSEKNDELERLLQELQIAQAQLVQAEKMAALGKLVAGVAHEMNSPIGASTSSIDLSKHCIAEIRAMLAACQSLEELKSGGRAEKLLASLLASNDVVSKANERLNTIVSSLKSFSNLDEAAFQEVDIHAGLDSTITLLETELKDIQVTKRYSKLPSITCYPGELNQAFLNLLTNSVEAIHSANRAGEIVVHTSLADKHICINFQDNGIGISPEKMSTLFDPAFTDKQTRVKASMGLFISQNIVQKHKGRITVTSKVNKGTRFTVVLPIDLEVRRKDSRRATEP